MTITEVKTSALVGGSGTEDNPDLRRVVTEKLEEKGSSGPWLWYVGEIMQTSIQSVQ